ncbi:MAG: CDGSH iron-sulfur domain-containing protein [Methanothrix sp.]|nr:CDGSH iron-sulfur domain-containing protein [Methanothrix sp.]
MNCDGRELAGRGPYALCRCGSSGKKPFCDGTHIKIGFDDAK